MSPAEPMTGSAFGRTSTCCVCAASTLPALSTEKNLNVVASVIRTGSVYSVLAVVGVVPSVV